MDIAFHYAKKRCNYGRQPMFCEQGPVLCDNIAANIAERRQYILRNPVHQPTQHTPIWAEQHINTIRAEFNTTGANHSEGGWPKDVNVTDPEATQRYKRKVEKDDNYVHCVMALAQGMDHYVQQNNAIDMYRTYYAEMRPTPALERNSCRIVNQYRDGGGVGPKRPISSICWQPEGGQRFAVTYLNLDLNRNPKDHIKSYIWDVDNANHPELTITPPCALLDLQYNQREPHIMAGGLLSGQVGVWDARMAGNPLLLSPPHIAHRDFVRNVLFINAKSGQEFFSAGPDGAVKWWDIRNMSETTDEMIMEVVKYSFETQTMARANGISVLEFEPTIPSRFMVGTENGLVITGNRKGKTPTEKLPSLFPAHLGPVWSLERNPGFLKNFLTVGDWTARVWSDDCRESSIVMSPPQRHKITAATWSPTRLSLMLLTQWNGKLAAWDLLRRQHEPIITMHICNEPLLRIKAHEAGSLVACGNTKGSIFMVELSSALTQSSRNDKTLLTAMFDREGKRERILESRMREIRLKLKQGGEKSPRGSLRDEGPFDVGAVTATYNATVKKELAAM